MHTEIEWQFEFPPEVQAEREIVLAAMSRAMDERTVEAIREAGEPIAMLAEALGIPGSAPQPLSASRVLAGTAAP